MTLVEHKTAKVNLTAEESTLLTQASDLLDHILTESENRGYRRFFFRTNKRTDENQELYGDENLDGVSWIIKTIAEGYLEAGV